MKFLYTENKSKKKTKKKQTFILLEGGGEGGERVRVSEFFI